MLVPHPPNLGAIELKYLLEHHCSSGNIRPELFGKLPHGDLREGWEWTAGALPKDTLLDGSYRIDACSARAVSA